MNKKLKYVLIISLIVVFILLATVIVETIVKSSNQVLYEIIYNDDSIPGERYDILIYSDRLEVMSTQFCSAVDCETVDSKKEVFEYSKDNMKKLKDFVEEDLKMKKNSVKELEVSSLSDYEYEVIDSLRLGQYFFEIAIEKYEYAFSYADSNNKEYNFYFKEDGTILVKVLLSNDDYEITGVEAYEVKFSKKNMDKLFEYAKNLTEENDGEKYYKNSTLYKDEKNIYLSLVENDETYLERKEVKLLYEINYNGINCPTPYIRLYDDDTYEYFYTFTTGDDFPTPRTGEYNYNIDMIIDGIDKYEENSRGPINIKVNGGKNYTTYDTNVELNAFLDMYNLKLYQCMEQEM